MIIANNCVNLRILERCSDSHDASTHSSRPANPADRISDGTIASYCNAKNILFIQKKNNTHIDTLYLHKTSASGKKSCVMEKNPEKS